MQSSPLAHFLSLSISLFFLMDPLGNLPLFVSILKNIDPEQQRKIIIRELLIALFVILFFAYLGQPILSIFHITQSTLGIAGGMILFIIALKMIFPKDDSNMPKPTSYKEPFIVPLAIPLVAGPTILAAVMIYSNNALPSIYLLSAIVTAWAFTLLILIFSDKIQKALRPRGIEACERLMGLILILLATQMFMGGLKEFMLSGNAPSPF